MNPRDPLSDPKFEAQATNPPAINRMDPLWSFTAISAVPLSEGRLEERAELCADFADAMLRERDRRDREEREGPLDQEEANRPVTETTDDAPQWAVVELMGHVRLVGILSEESKFGTTMGRIEALQPGHTFITQWFSVASVYRVTPTDETTARQMVALSALPKSAFSLPAPDDDDDDAFEDGL